MKIVHIADIHWRGITRHDEYTQAFETLYTHIEKIKPDIIYLGGDIFHTKTQGISPEVIEKLHWMFKSLADLAPTHVILGNHDGNLANEDRQDIISPIINAMNHTKLFLYKKSGVYPAGDIYTAPISDQEYTPVNFCVFSCFDHDGWEKVHPEENAINIALYHGSISGCETDSNWVMQEGEQDISMFNEYDFAMFGDIHKQQYLATRLDSTGDHKPWAAYPGSLIQQNFGEDEVKGFLVWDIRGKNDWDVEFVELENKQPFVTVSWAGNVQETLNNIKTTRKDRAFLPGARFRVSSSVTISPVEARQLQGELKGTHQASELTFKFDTESKIETIQTDSVAVHKTALRNNITAIQNLYKEFITANATKFPLTDAQITEAETIISSYLTKFNSTETETARDITWSIKDFKFDNLFRYGENNSINFSKLEGIVGVFGPNRIGKSSIVGSMMYGLFNTTDRGPMKNGNIINYVKKFGNAKLRINVSGTDYIIERQSLRQDPPKRKGAKVENFDPDKTITNLNLFRVQPDEKLIELNSITRDDTDKEVRKLIGKADDFLLTAFSSQGGINRFIEEGATQRKAILNRFLDLDIFEKLFLFSKDDVSAINAKTSKFSTTSWDQLIFDSEMKVAGLEAEHLQVHGMVEDLQQKIEDLKLWIATNKPSENIEENKKEIVKIERLLAETQRNFDVALKQKQTNESAIIAYSNTIERLKKAIESTDIVDIKAKKMVMTTFEKKLSELNSNQKEQSTILQTQERSIKKLALVPCGDQFPTCHYIKDSHEDKKLIEDQRKLVESIASDLEVVKVSLKEFYEEKLDQKISDFDNNTKNLETAQRDLHVKEITLEKIKSDIKHLEAQLKSQKETLENLNDQISTTDSGEFEQKKTNLNILQKQLAEKEREKSNLLIKIGAERAKTEQLEKDKIECQTLLGQLRIFESIQSAFSKTGIPAMVLKTQLPAINLELSKLLSNIIDFKILLETDTNSNAMDVYIEDGHSKRIIELASGMEKMLASLALRVALVNLSSLPKPDIFIVDEGFGVLDDDGIQKCMQLLSVMKTYFKTILVISHVSTIKEVADQIIEVVNNGTESKIEV